MKKKPQTILIVEGSYLDETTKIACASKAGANSEAAKLVNVFLAAARDDYAEGEDDIPAEDASSDYW
jgi:hypothetical protein